MQRTIAHDLSFELYLPAHHIQERVQTLGLAIRHQYENKNPVFIGVLNGAFLFIADLVRAAQIPCEVDFIKVASYVGTTSTNKMKKAIGLSKDIKHRHIILVEDIVDTGNTFAKLLPDLQALAPASMTIATLLLKPEALQHSNLPIQFVGFEIPNKFVIGYGLDYNEVGRQLEGIYQLVE